MKHHSPMAPIAAGHFSEFTGGGKRVPTPSLSQACMTEIGTVHLGNHTYAQCMCACMRYVHLNLLDLVFVSPDLSLGMGQA